MKKSGSGYVVAGYQTLVRILTKFLKVESNREYFDEKDISKFLSSVCQGFLSSYGSTFADRKKYINYNFRQSQNLRKIRKTCYFDDSDLVVDSGGYQVSIGQLSLEQSNLLMKLYYEFLEDYHEDYDRAFILDLPPGPGCKIIHNEKQLYDLNLESYKKAQELPDHVRKKIIYVHHFRTPMLHRCYNKLLRENDFFNSFEKFGTGAIVANSRSDMAIPAILFVFPIICLLNECIKNKRKKLDFHVLGSAGFRDILCYELFSVHVKKIHDIELNITYDSSGIFKGLMMSRVTQIFDGEIYTKIDLRGSKINLRYKNGLKVIDLFRNEIEDLSTRHPYLKKFRFDEIYQIKENGEYGTFNEDVRIYSLLYALEQFSRVQTIVSGKVKDYLYDLYESENTVEFLNEICEIIKTFNGGKLTKKQHIKSMSIKPSLDLLTTLDEDKCEYLINTYLSKDEFVDLNSNTKVLTI